MILALSLMYFHPLVLSTKQILLTKFNSVSIVSSARSSYSDDAQLKTQQQATLFNFSLWFCPLFCPLFSMCFAKQIKTILLKTFSLKNWGPETYLITLLVYIQ